MDDRLFINLHPGTTYLDRLTGKTKVRLFLAFVLLLGILLLAAALVFGTELSVTVIFALVLLCEGLKAILGGIYVRMGKWVRNLAGQYE